MTILLARPKHSQWGNELINLAYSSGVWRILIELHDNKSGNARQFIQSGKPLDSRLISALDIYEDISIK